MRELAVVEEGDVSLCVHFRDPGARRFFGYTCVEGDELRMVSAAAAFNRQVSPFLLLRPVYMLLIGLFSKGIGWFVSSLHVYLRDTAQIVTVLLTLWFWMTPILVSEEQVPKKVRFILVANPMFYAVKAYRNMLLYSDVPGLADTAAQAGSAALAFLLGGFFFRYMKKGFADVL